ncbi:MAG TPA: hypothetical protein PKJ45_13600, partial [Rubrivivax sp.]|nr:hypothetical protein [Rubrivivax sp.]
AVVEDEDLVRVDHGREAVRDDERRLALRAHARDIAKRNAASGLTNDEGEPFSQADLAPFYDRVEKVLSVRERGDWGKSVFTAQAVSGNRPRAGAGSRSRRLHLRR